LLRECRRRGIARQVIRYGQDHWAASRIEAEINQASEWARQRNVWLVCNEFGVYRADAPAADRAAWIKDVRASLERHKHRVDHLGLLWQFWRGFEKGQQSHRGSIRALCPGFEVAGLKSLPLHES
jgi:hypothetical protein